MPCNSDYLCASRRELEMSRVCCLLDELKTGNPVDTSSREWDGYHPKIYNKSRGKAVDDALVATLCRRLKNVYVPDYSLEMQIFLRDHAKADLERQKKDTADKKAEEERKRVLSKLTPAERKLLRI